LAPRNCQNLDRTQALDKVALLSDYSAEKRSFDATMPAALKRVTAMMMGSGEPLYPKLPDPPKTPGLHLPDTTPPTPSLRVPGHSAPRTHHDNPMAALSGPRTEKERAKARDRHSSGERISLGIDETHERLRRIRPGELYDPNTLRPLHPGPTPEEKIQRLEETLRRVQAKNQQYQDELRQIKGDLDATRQQLLDNRVVLKHFQDDAAERAKQPAMPPPPRPDIFDRRRE
jgi:hypothetical protein